MSRPLILLSNDDGYQAKGFKTLIDIVKNYGDVIAVSTPTSQSGMSHAITLRNPLRFKKVIDDDNVHVYTCNGTPADCVKIALDQIVPRKPDFLFSGINHGSNSSISSVYSGTIGVVREGCINGIPSAGFSLLNHNLEADFTAARLISTQIIEHILENGLPDGTCLNVNYPDIPMDEIKGLKVCRQTPGVWKQEFEKKFDPYGDPYYWLTGYFHNFEPEADDTDEWALANKYAAVVPLKVDMTAYNAIEKLKTIEFEVPASE